MVAPSKSKVYFFYETPLNIKDRTNLKRFIESIFKQEGCRLQNLNYIFCSDKRILEINKQFLEHNYYTDILTFQFSELNEPIEGEIYISVDRVKDNAKSLNEFFGKELLRVIFHGALHLCGYNDKKKGEVRKMRQREAFYLRRYLV